MSQPNTPTRAALERAVAFRLALREFHADTERAVRSAGLTGRQYLLLLVLESSPGRAGMRVGDLADALKLVPSSVTELIDRAESAGLVERVHSAEDGRVTQVRSTTEGRARLRRAFFDLEDERRALADSALTLIDGE